jgi:mannose/fructose-specific phosphotransferase system component IIA
MFNVLLVTHGKLSEEFLTTACMIYGRPAGNVATLGFSSEQTQEDLLLRIKDCVYAAADEGGCLILCDILGGSPFLMAAKAYQELKSQFLVEVVSGLNLGMLIEVLSCQEDMSLLQGKQVAIDAAKRSIFDLANRL